MMSWLWLVAAVSAADCTPLAAADFRVDLEAARAALAEENEAQFQQVRARVVAEIPCLSAVVDPNDWARFLVVIAAFAYHQEPRGDWRSPLDAALAADRNVDTFDPVFASAKSTVGREEYDQWGPTGTDLYMDGGLVAKRLVHGPHLIQASADGILVSAYADDLDSSDWDALLARLWVLQGEAAAQKAAQASASNPPVSEPTPAATAEQDEPVVVAPDTRRNKSPESDPGDSRAAGKSMIVAGAVGVVAGLGVAIGTYVGADNHTVIDPDDNLPGILLAANAAGWVVVAAGVGAGITGVVLLDGGPVTILPGAIRIGGSF